MPYLFLSKLHFWLFVGSDWSGIRFYHAVHALFGLDECTVFWVQGGKTMLAHKSAGDRTCSVSVLVSGCVLRCVIAC